MLLLGFVAFLAELNTFGEAGLCSLVMVNAGGASVLLPEGGTLVVPGVGEELIFFVSSSSSPNLSNKT